jgi:hypothetical protein
MQVRQFLKMTIAVLVLLIGLTAPVLASNNQSNQAMNQPATLISPEPSFEIGVYPKPNGSPKRIGFGLGGDRITILEQVGSNEGNTWDFVQFENTQQPEGWVQDEFVALQASDRFASRVHTAPNIRHNAQQSNQQGNSSGGLSPSRYQGNQYQGNEQQSYGQQQQYP